MAELGWLKSSFSEDGGNNCIEIARLPGHYLAVRESSAPECLIVANRLRLQALLTRTKQKSLLPPGR
ncbi:DUF397 domain-containing protein [Streptomyces aidingensis]|uniref:DUF397 domain-containing protein n=1 Tax=Streptomyces aidingensis TaxID=910347 RepID=A0A1I1Q1D5_9ACTN|nr:protein of unknown function [Streptomyces aidingensis]